LDGKLAGEKVIVSHSRGEVLQTSSRDEGA